MSPSAADAGNGVDRREWACQVAVDPVPDATCAVGGLASADRIEREQKNVVAPERELAEDVHGRRGSVAVPAEEQRGIGVAFGTGGKIMQNARASVVQHAEVPAVPMVIGSPFGLRILRKGNALHGFEKAPVNQSPKPPMKTVMHDGTALPDEGKGSGS